MPSSYRHSASSSAWPRRTPAWRGEASLVELADTLELPVPLPDLILARPLSGRVRDHERGVDERQGVFAGAFALDPGERVIETRSSIRPRRSCRRRQARRPRCDWPPLGAALPPREIDSEEAQLYGVTADRSSSSTTLASSLAIRPGAAESTTPSKESCSPCSLGRGLYRLRERLS